MSLIFQNGSRTQSFGPGEKMPALPQQPKASQPSFGKPPGSSQDWYLHKQPAAQPKQPSGATQYAGGTPGSTGRPVAPGQAQSQQQPSTGTKYGAYRPPSSQTSGDPRGMLANAPPSQRPPPIQMGVAQTPWGQSMDPFAERDAFVRQIGNQRMNNQIAFNTSGPNAPQGSPFINYDMARQNAGLGGGAPSMNAKPEDTFIGRFNNQFGAPVNPGFGGGLPQPAAGYPGFDPRTQAPSGQPLRPGGAQPIAPPPQGTPYRQPPSQPQYGTPPEQRGGFRTADWRDGDKDGVDDRDQDGPGMPAYGQPPQTGVRASPGFDPRIHGYNPGMPVQRPVSGPTRPPMPVRMPYAGGMDYETGPPVQRPGLTLRPPPSRRGMAGYQTTRRR